jgi:hypothetical protein
MSGISVGKLLTDGSIIRIAVNISRTLNTTNKNASVKNLKVSENKINWLPSYGLRENFETYIIINIDPKDPILSKSSWLRS